LFLFYYFIILLLIMLNLKNTKNILFHTQWLVSLLFYVIFNHSIYALVVDFSATPSSGAQPLFVTLSTRNQVVPSPGFVVSGYQWQLSGPTGTSELAGVAEQVVELKQAGGYVISLTITEFSLAGGTRQVTNTGSISKNITVSSSSNPLPIPDTGTLPKPTISISPNTSKPVRANQSVSFSVNNSSSFPSGTTYTWDVNPTTAQLSSRTSMATITFTQPTTYRITVTASQDDQTQTSEIGLVVSPAQEAVTPPPDAPVLPTPTPTPSKVPTLNVSNLSVRVSEIVRLNVTNAISGVNYKWNVTPTGGTQISAQNSFATLLFSRTGVYQVTVTVNNQSSTPTTIVVSSQTQTPSENIPPSTIPPSTISGAEIEVLTEDGSPGTTNITDFFVNFGTTPRGTAIDQKFTLKNTGNALLTANFQLLKSKGFSLEGVVISEQLQIAAHAEKSFLIRLNANETGTFDDIFQLTTNDSDEQSLVFYLTGVVTSNLSSTDSFTVTTSEFVPATVFLDASKASAGRTIDTYLWESGDGTDGVVNSQEGPFAFMTFKTGGLHPIKLSIISGEQRETVEYYITIPPLQHRPIPRFTITQQGNMFWLDGSSSFDPDGGAIQSYQWTGTGGTIVVNTGEKAQFQVASSPNANESSITLAVMDDEGTPEQITATITSNNIILPVANFHSSDLKEVNKIQATMEMDISASFHPDPENKILGYQWFLGTSSDCMTAATDQNVLEIDERDTFLHTLRFLKAGIYNLCLKVIDGLSTNNLFPTQRSDIYGKQVTIVGDYSTSSYETTGFRGGVLIKDKFLPNNAVFKRDSFVDLVTEITAATGYENGSVNVYVVAAYTPIGAKNPQFFMKDGKIANFRKWDSKIENLVPAYTQQIFDENKKIHFSIFSGQFNHFPGQYTFYVSYDWSDLDLLTRWNEGFVVHNLSKPISFTVVP
jgi:hypothetical protein